VVWRAGTTALAGGSLSFDWLSWFHIEGSHQCHVKLRAPDSFTTKGAVSLCHSPHELTNRLESPLPMPTSTAVVSKKPAVGRRLGSRATRWTKPRHAELAAAPLLSPHNHRPPLPARDRGGLLRRRRVCELADLVAAEPAGQDCARGSLRSSGDSNCSGSCGAGDDCRALATFPPGRL